MLRIVQFIFKYFVVLPPLYLGAAYFLVSQFCAPGGLFVNVGSGGGASPTPPSTGFFDGWDWPFTWKVLLGGLVLSAIIIRVARRTQLGGFLALLWVGFLADRYDRLPRDSYPAVWVKRRILSAWRWVHPKDKKTSVKAIAEVILAGYGFHPEDMPKRARKTAEPLPEPKVAEQPPADPTPNRQPPVVVYPDEWDRAA